MGEAKRRKAMAEAATEAVRRGDLVPFLNLETGEIEFGRAAGSPTKFIADWRRRMDRKVSTGETEPASVPCNGCIACCYYKSVDVNPAADDISQLDVVPNPEQPGGFRLRKAENGACVHLTAIGCGVYDHRPVACKDYDCRVYGLAGMVERYDNGQVGPRWVFRPENDDEYAYQMALGMGAKLHMSTAPGATSQSALVHAFKTVDATAECLREVRDCLRRLPPEDREEVLQAGRAHLASLSRPEFSSSDGI